MTVKLFGKDDTTATYTSSANFFELEQYVAVASGTCTELHCHVMASKSGNVRMAVYADNSGAPGAMLGYTAATAITSGSERSVTIQLVSSFSMVYGTAYWIAFVTDTSALLGNTGDTGVIDYKSWAYGALPDPAGSGWTYLTTRNFIQSGWGTIDVTVNAPTATVSSQAYATTTTGGAKSSPPTATVSSQALAPSVQDIGRKLPAGCHRHQ